MRRWLALAFLCLLFLQVGGAYLYFGVRLLINRQEMRARLRELPDAALTRFDLTPSEWQQVRVEDDELRINGKMYDIARSVHGKDRIVIWALADAAEDNLLSFVTALVERHSSDNQPIPTTVMSLQGLVYDAPQPVILAPFRSAARAGHTRHLESIISASRTVPTQPPRFFFFATY